MTNHENESIAKIVQRVRTNRFHGPKERARQIFLRYPPESVMSPKQAVKYLFDTYHIEKQVQRVVPYSVTHAGLTLNILVTWVGFFAETRQRLYDEAPAIVQNTGWYPLITGAFSYVSRQLVELVLDKIPRLQLKSTTTGLELGEPLKLRSVSKTGFGTSFILETSSLSILMDFGFECPSLDYQDVDVFILSHVHQDHFGGFFDAVKRYRPRIIMMSEPTTRLVVNYLLSGGEKPEDFEMLMSKVLSVPLNTRLQFRDGGNMIFVDSNHMLGSMMSLIQFPRGNSLLYTSDCRIDHSASGVPGTTGPVNSPLDTVSTLMKDTSLDCMILDATFVGREGGNTETQSLDGLLSKVRAALSVGARIFLMFDNADHGFSLYESIYEAFLQGLSKMRNIAVYMGLEIYTFSRWVIRQYVRKEVQSLDPRLLQFLKRRKNVFEPVALYRNNYGAQANLNLKYHSSRGEKLIFLESLACLNRLEKLLVESGTTARENDLVFSIGRMGALARFREKIERSNAFRSAEIAYLTGAEWSLHSSESALRSFLEQTECANRIYLFHNNEERLAAFSKTLHNPKIESICAVPDTVELS